MFICLTRIDCTLLSSSGKQSGIIAEYCCKSFLSAISPINISTLIFTACMPLSIKTSDTAALASVTTDAPTAAPRRGRPRQQYECQHCGRQFKRSEHCVRHERTHTRDKPYVCRYCKKPYGRKYVLHCYPIEQLLHMVTNLLADPEI